LAAAHILRVNHDKMVEDRPILLAYEIFFALNADFSCLSADLLGSRRPAQTGVKKGYPSKKWLFYCYWLVYCENGCR